MIIECFLKRGGIHFVSYYINQQNGYCSDFLCTLYQDNNRFNKRQVNNDDIDLAGNINWLCSEIIHVFTSAESSHPNWKYGGAAARQMGTVAPGRSFKSGELKKNTQKKNPIPMERPLAAILYEVFKSTTK